MGFWVSWLGVVSVVLWSAGKAHLEEKVTEMWGVLGNFGVLQWAYSTWYWVMLYRYSCIKLKLPPKKKYKEEGIFLWSCWNHFWESFLSWYSCLLPLFNRKTLLSCFEKEKSLGYLTVYTNLKRKHAMCQNKSVHCSVEKPQRKPGLDVWVTFHSMPRN